MKRLYWLQLSAMAAIFTAATVVHAHAPVLDCYVQQGRVQCEAGFSDGSSAAGRKIQVLDTSNRLLLEGVIDKAGGFSFKPPVFAYHVVFQGGEQHQVTLYSINITE